MSRTTLPDTAFDRADNFLSNECNHTRFPFQITSSQSTNQKSSGFCVFRFQTDFDEREHFVVIPLSQHSLHLICKMCTKHPRPTRASIIFSTHLGLSSKRPPRLAMHPFRCFVKACMALATRCWEIWAQHSLRRSFRLSIHWIFTTHQPLQLSPDEEVHVMSRLFGGQASDLRYRRQMWLRYM